LEKVVREAILDIKGTILHKSLQILAHADDVVIVEIYENAELKWKHKKWIQ
jgi:hypothetical protein